LDTNVVSESVRARPNRKVIDWVAAQARDHLSISIVTLAELQHGAALALDQAQRSRLLRWIEADVVPFFDQRTISLSVDILTDWMAHSKRLRSARKIGDAADLLIASTARVHSLTVVTRNVRDFADTGIVVYDPWHDQTHRMVEP
jgi:predicted nucleic acid-binding protein